MRPTGMKSLSAKQIIDEDETCKYALVIEEVLLSLILLRYGSDLVIIGSSGLVVEHPF